MNLKDFNYVHIGAKYISKDLWVNIIHEEETKKPIGGLWTCPFNNIAGSISDWTDFLLENENLFYRMPHDEGCLLKVNSKSNICRLDSDNAVQQIKQKHDMPVAINYEKLATLYDAAFVSPFSMSSQLRHTEFNNWNIRTLLLFNLDIIDSYAPITIEYKDYGFYIKEVEKLKIIEDTSKQYNLICDLANQLFEKRLQNTPTQDPYKLKQCIIRIEHDIYKYVLEQVNYQINSKFENSEIIKAILLNERHKHYKKRI